MQTSRNDRVGIVADSMISIEICIDVPDLARGIRFYADAFGFAKTAEPYPGVAVLQAGGASLTLLEKGEQSKPSPITRDVPRLDCILRRPVR